MTLVEANEILNRYSQLPCLLKKTALCVRWLKKYRHLKTTQHVNVEEMHNAKHIWVRQIQNSCFKKEMDCLRSQKPLPSNSPLLSLLPILDKNDIIRVGGRLSRSLLPFEAKHPIILPTNHKLTELVIRQAHLRA